MNVVVYSKLNCPQCVKVKNELERKAVEFTEVLIDHDTDARQQLLDQGFRSVPVVFVDGKHTDPATITNEII